MYIPILIFVASSFLILYMICFILIFIIWNWYAPFSEIMLIGVDMVNLDSYLSLQLPKSSVYRAFIFHTLLQNKSLAMLNVFWTSRIAWHYTHFWRKKSIIIETNLIFAGLSQKLNKTIDSLCMFFFALNYLHNYESCN